MSVENPVNNHVLAEDILTQVKEGCPYQWISAKMPWLSLPLEDRIYLLERARSDEPISDKLIRLLAHMVQNLPSQYRWDQIHVLFLSISRLNWDERKKEIAFQKIEYLLEDLEKNESGGAVSEEHKLEVRATFYKLRGWFNIERNQCQAAFEDFDKAIECYRLSEDSEQIKLLTSQINGIKKLISVSISPVVNIDLHLAELKLNSELEHLLSLLSQKKAEYETISQKIEEKARENINLSQIIQKRAMELNDLTRQVQYYSVYLNFLMKLRETSLSPIWLEVLRLALKQGQIDRLAIHAIERLLPEIANIDSKLFQEVVSRLPEMNGVEIPEGFPADAQVWLEKINQVKEMKSQNTTQAAMKIVEAWETILRLRSFM